MPLCFVLVDLGYKTLYSTLNRLKIMFPTQAVSPSFAEIEYFKLKKSGLREWNN